MHRFTCKTGDDTTMLIEEYRGDEGYGVGMGHHIKALVGRHIFIDGGDPGDEQEAS